MPETQNFRANAPLTMHHGHPASLAVPDEAAAPSRHPAFVGVIGAGLLPRELAVQPGGRTALVTNSASHRP